MSYLIKLAQSKIHDIRDRLHITIHPPKDYWIHAKCAIDWLCRAQDVSNGGGIAHSYSSVYGWKADYPETTGYIIPTLFEYAKLLNHKELYERAIKATDWITEVQLESGGIQAGTINSSLVVPTIFNTGQCLFGWARAYRESGNETYLQALNKAAIFLVSSQDDDGKWTKYPSTKTNFGINTYNTRTAWGLYEAYLIEKNEQFRDGALANIEWALTQQNENNWFNNNCLTDNLQPFTHTIAYALRGILEIGTYENRDDLIDIIINASKKIISQLDDNGILPGRLNSEYMPTVKYACLTGSCQMAIIWSKLYKLTGENFFSNASDKVIRFVCSTQAISNRCPNIMGAIKGSFPFGGEYCKYAYPNWATKFFLDALHIGNYLNKVNM